MTDDAFHPPGCECGQHPFVDPGTFLIRRLEREALRLLAALTPAEARILAARRRKR